MVIIIFLRNFQIIVISIKCFFNNFFGDLEFLLRVWNLLFLIIVLLISFTVIIFSFAYIRTLWVTNFVLLYSIFIIRMVWLIINTNFYWIIFGWDGLGVVSFLLIIFYINYERINNGLFTLFQNRLGDLFFVFFILFLIEIRIIINLMVKFGLLFLILGRCVKRAQFPFNSWLLSAISAPTPISSLVHSSTLVVAGVYILLQFRYCLINVLIIIKYLRFFSLLVRRFGLLNERDIKKLIAYSTINHVALIIYFLRYSLYKIVYFHLNIHAIFKSLMFISFGYVILSSFHGQDNRLISYISLNPVVKIIYYFSCMCLAGLPFLRAFFSKDFIVEKIIEYNNEYRFIIIFLFFLSLRIYYSIKLLNIKNCIFSYYFLEKNFYSIFRLLLIFRLIILIVNLYIFLIFTIRLEFVSFKFFIYLMILFFFILSFIIKLNFKLRSYNITQNFKEIWMLNFNSFDQYIYQNIFILLQNLRIMNNSKILLLLNWWVLIFFIVVF